MKAAIFKLLVISTVFTTYVRARSELGPMVTDKVCHSFPVPYDRAYIMIFRAIVNNETLLYLSII